MAQDISLLDFLIKLMGDQGLRDWFSEDPERVLEEYKLTDLTAEDVHDAAVLIEDSQTADFSRNYDTGDTAVHLPPAPQLLHASSGGSHDSHKAAIEYINTYVTNSHVDDRDTIVDNSFNQQIDNRGGTFDQDVDIDNVVAAGEGSVAAGGDIRDSNVVTGDKNQVGDDSVFGHGNVIGDGNSVVNGDGNTTSFGDGDANSAHFDNVSVSKGGALSVGGDAQGSHDISDSFNKTETTTTTTNTNENSFNTETNTNEGSFNEDSSENNFASKNDVDVTLDSHNDTTFES